VTEMKNRLLPLLIVVAVLAALAATVSYAVAHATNGGNNNYRSMMNGSGSTMMGTNNHRTAWYVNGSGPVADIASARAQAQKFADRLGLKTGEVMQFANNFYVLLTDSQGKPATEVLVDPETGTVTLEYGPAMMWNTRYGMMGRASRSWTGSGMMGGGMMSGNWTGRYGTGNGWDGGGQGTVTSLAQAVKVADRWLSQARQGERAETDGRAFPGYYTLDTTRSGKTTGMLSVNASTGAVWYHSWHGRFLAERKF